MRKYFMVMLLAGFLAPQASLACPSINQSTIKVNCESGVSVYRGTPLAAPNVRVQPKQRHAASKTVNASQQALIAAQERRINALEDNLERAHQPQSRGRYNRSFSVPIGAFGRGTGSGFGGSISPRFVRSVSFGRQGAFGRRRF